MAFLLLSLQKQHIYFHKPSHMDVGNWKVNSLLHLPPGWQLLKGAVNPSHMALHCKLRLTCLGPASVNTPSLPVGCTRQCYHFYSPVALQCSPTLCPIWLAFTATLSQFCSVASRWLGILCSCLLNSAWTFDSFHALSSLYGYCLLTYLTVQFIQCSALLLLGYLFGFYSPIALCFIYPLT